MRPTSPKFVRDLMTVGVPTCPPETLVADIARLLAEKNFEEVVVLEEGHNVGVVGFSELVKVYDQEDALKLTAEQVMRPGIPTTLPDIPLETAAQLMRDQNVRVLYLTHHASGVEYPAASISYTHFIRHLAARDDQDLNDLGVDAARLSPLEIFIHRRDAARRKATGKT
jgi:predicted transcriptional regulator